MKIPTKQPEKTKSREQQIADRLAQIPESQLEIYLRATKGKNRAAGVKAFCYQCCGYEREEVKLCTDLGCPLWMYRPGRGKKTCSIPRKANGERFSAVESTNGISDAVRVGVTQ
ncbi:MAG: hypothetical protein MUP16_00850 [Sedimentisphaerales bacterium]|nr:hypothetical protein [Sedimentisphaerales bacterium]